MRKLLRKIGYVKVMLLLTFSAIVIAEILAYIVIKFFSFPYIPSTPIVTFAVTLLTTPFISWALLKLLFDLDKMEENMYLLATYDSMTMLLRREAFFHHATRVHQVTQQHTLSYSIAIIDIDNFKYINDTYGHAGGDKVIVHFGQTLLELFTLKNPIGRIGGEEFALLFPIDVENMEKEMEVVHTILQEASIAHDGDLIEYTVSIGIFENTIPDQITLDKALSYADKALYEAKCTGKKKSVTYYEKVAFNDIPCRSENLRANLRDR